MRTIGSVGIIPCNWSVFYFSPKDWGYSGDTCMWGLAQTYNENVLHTLVRNPRGELSLKSIVMYE